MKSVRHFIILLFTIMMMAGCQGKKTGERGSGKEETEISGSEKERVKEEITLSPLVVRQLYEDAILEMNEPEEYRLTPAGETLFSYEVTNFRLGDSGHNPVPSGMAVYFSGSHITLILNNEIHLANVRPQFDITLKAGHFVTLSFLTNDDYVSLKGPEAYVLRQFSAGKTNADDLDLSGPNIFYHMPSGSFAGDDTRNILLDFYLVHCRLSGDGYKVKATINGKDFTIDNWAPYIIRGLPFGESTITLELLDNNGSVVTSPFHSVTKKITLYEREPV